MLPSVFWAQSLSETTMQQANLSIEESARYAVEASRPEALNAKLVTATDPGSGLGVVSFSLPGYVGTLQAEPIITNYKNSEDYQRSYRFTNALGYAILTRYQGQMLGRISVGSRVWAVAPVANGVAALREVDSSYSVGDCGPETESIASGLSCQSESSCPAYIDVLILFSQHFDNGLVDSHGNIVNSWGIFFRRLIVSYLELEINTVILNSQIPGKHVRCVSNPIGSFVFTFTDNAQIDLAGVTIQSAALRTAAGADLVTLVRSDGGVYVFQNGIVYGISSTPTNNCPSPSSNCVYSIIDGPVAMGGFMIFSHETGHNVGLRHEKAQSPGGLCNHAHLFVSASGAERHTAVTAKVTSAVIPHYSNPDVFFDGVSTGSEVADNAGAFSANACQVANYLNGGLSATVTGSYGPHCDNDPPFQLTANIHQPISGWGYTGLPPYFLSWRKSLNEDMSGATAAGSGTTITISPSTLGAGTWWFELTVLSLADNSTFIATPKAVKIIANCFGSSGDRNADSKESPAIFEILPNPANDFVEIHFLGTEELPSCLQIWNSQGQTLIEKRFLKADFRETFNISPFGDGLYLITFEQAGKREMKKLIISQN